MDDRKNKRIPEKTFTSASVTTLNPLTVWITTNCGKFLNRWEYQTEHEPGPSGAGAGGRRCGPRGPASALAPLTEEESENRGRVKGEGGRSPGPATGKKPGSWGGPAEPLPSLGLAREERAPRRRGSRRR